MCNVMELREYVQERLKNLKSGDVRHASGIGVGTEDGKGRGNGDDNIMHKKDQEQHNPQVQEQGLMGMVLKHVQQLYQHEVEMCTRKTTKSLETLQKMLQYGRFLLLVDQSMQMTSGSRSETTLPTQMGILGVAYLCGSSDDPLLEDIIIDSRHRHCGHGSRLLQLSLDHPTIATSSHVDLYCAHDLLPFYQKNGFTIVRTSETERCYLRWNRMQKS